MDMQRNLSYLVRHSCGVIKALQHLSVSKINLLQGVQNRLDLDNVKGLLVVHKSETERLIILLELLYDLNYRAYVVYGAKSSAIPGLHWWFEVVQPSHQPIFDKPGKQLVDVEYYLYLFM